MLNVCTSFAADENGHEIMPHGADDFPCLGYDEYHTDRPGGDFPWHWHNDFEVIICDSGHIRVKVPGSSTVLAAGDACFVNLGQMHYIIGAPEGRMRSIVVYPPMLYGTRDSVFATRYVSPLIRDESLALVTFRGDSPTECVAAACIDQAISALAEEKFGFEFVIREQLSRMVVEILANARGKHAKPDRRMSVDASRVRAMCDHVDAHFSEQLTVAEIAAAGGVGQRECLRCFRRILDTTPSRYLLQRRITAGAAMLLRDPNASVADVSRSVGVRSASNFTQLFRREYRCTPREYRARMLAQAEGVEVVTSFPETLPSSHDMRR